MTDQENHAMFSELFERLRKTEMNTALLSQEQKTLNKAFEQHNKDEMEKYGKIQVTLDQFKRILWILVGIGIASSDFAGSLLSKLAIGM